MKPGLRPQVLTGPASVKVVDSRRVPPNSGISASPPREPHDFSIQRAKMLVEGDSLCQRIAVDEAIHVSRRVVKDL